MNIVAKCAYCNAYLDDRYNPEIHFGDVYIYVYPCEGCLKNSYEEGLEEAREVSDN